MKINISRPNLYIIITSIFLLIFVLLFSFLVLIPQGKEYRKARVELKSKSKDLRKYQNFSDETEEILTDLQKKHRHIITAFDTKFSAQRFKKQYKQYFSSLKISQISKAKPEDEFLSYEVNTVSQINSPKSFYNFLDAINKADWIVGVNFPIEFVRDGELIKSTFSMKVLCNNKEDNSTKAIKKVEK